MALDDAANFAKAAVTSGYDSAATSIAVSTQFSGAESIFPAPPFNAVWWNWTDFPDPSDDPLKEIVRVLDVSANVFPSITRAQEGTSAQAHNSAGKVYRIAAGPTAKLVDDIQSAIDAVSAAEATLAADVANAISTEFDAGLASTASVVIDWADGGAQKFDLSGVPSFATPANMVAGRRYVLRLSMGTSAAHSANWASAFLWNGSVPALGGSSAAAVLGFYCDGNFLYAAGNDVSVTSAEMAAAILVETNNRISADGVLSGAIAAVSANHTSLVSDVGRISVALSGTQSDVARISVALSGAISDIAKISANHVSLVSDVARISVALSGTGSDVARISVALSGTQSDVSRISLALSGAISDIAKISANHVSLVSDVGRISVALSGTASDVARISLALSGAISDIAKISTAHVSLVSDVGRISVALSGTASDVARISLALSGAISTLSALNAYVNKAVVSEFDAGIASTVSVTIDWANGGAQKFDLSGVPSFANPSNISAGRRYILRLSNGTSAAHSANWATAFVWPSSTPPSLGGSSAVDLIAFYADAAGNLLGSYGGGTGGGVTTAEHVSLVDRVSANSAQMTSADNALLTRIDSAAVGNAGLSSRIDSANVQQVSLASDVGRISVNAVSLASDVNRISGLVAAGLTSAGPFRRVLAGDQLVTQTAPVSLSGFTFTVSAGVAYQMKMVLLVSAPISAAGPKFVLSLPGTPTQVGVVYQYFGGPGVSVVNVAATDVTVQFVTVSATGITRLVLIDGGFIASAAGTVALAVGNNISGAGAGSLITFRAGSSGYVWRMG